MVFVYLLINEIIKFYKRFPTIIKPKERDQVYKYSGTAARGSCNECLRVFDIDSTKYNNMKASMKVITVLVSVIKKVIVFLITFVKALLTYSLNFSHLLYLLHVISTFFIIILWYSINEAQIEFPKCSDQFGVWEWKQFW